MLLGTKTRIRRRNTGTPCTLEVRTNRKTRVILKSDHPHSHAVKRPPVSIDTDHASIISLSESGCRVLIKDLKPDEINAGQELTLHSSIAHGLTLRTRIARAPQEVDDWGTLLVLTFQSLDPTTYTHLMEYLRGLRTEQKTHASRENWQRVKRRLKTRAKRMVILFTALVLGLTGIGYFGYMQGWFDHVIGRTQAPVEEHVIVVVKEVAEKPQIRRELLDSLSPEERKAVVIEHGLQILRLAGNGERAIVEGMLSDEDKQEIRDWAASQE